MTYFSGAYDAGASVVGMSDLVTFINNTAPYRRILRMNEYGDPIKDKDAMIKLSPITHIKKVKDPLLVIQGVNDPRVPVGEAIQMHRELVKKNIPTGLILFSDEGHGASKRENVVQEIGHMISFFKKYLK
jgi:dipeptidyl aminopeptidase/acylaminoacyl peptidase